MSQVSDTYLQAQAAEAKYWPFYGSVGFSGDYASLTINEKIWGAIRVLESAHSVEVSMATAFAQQLAQQCAQQVQGASETDLRLFKSVTHVQEVTKARLKANAEAIQSLKALVTNTYSTKKKAKGGEETKVCPEVDEPGEDSPADSDSGDSDKETFTLRVGGNKPSDAGE